jgi:hypothetical protein
MVRDHYGEMLKIIAKYTLRQLTSGGRPSTREVGRADAPARHREDTRVAKTGPGNISQPDACSVKICMTLLNLRSIPENPDVMYM